MGASGVTGGRRAGALLLAAVLATGLAACGDDDGDDGGDVALEDVDGSGSGSGTEDTDGSGGSSDDSTDDTDDTDDDTDLGEFDFGSEECQQIFGALSGFGAGFADPENPELDFGVIAEIFDELRDGAPAIEDELETLADAYREFDDRVGTVDFSDPSVFTSPEFAEASEIFSDPGIAEANEAVSTFFTETCGSS